MGCGAATGAEARERWGVGAPARAGNGDGEVAAAELDWGGVARGGGIQRGVEWGQEVTGVPRVAVEQQEVACGPPRRWVALNCAGGGEAERERGGRRRVDLFVNSENSRDPTVNQQ